MRASKGSLARLACFKVVAVTSSQGRRRPAVWVLQWLKLRCMSWPGCLRCRVYCCVCEGDAFVFVCLLICFWDCFATLSNCSGRVLHTCSLFVFLFFSLSANCKGYVLSAYLWATLLTLWEMRRLCIYLFLYWAYAGMFI